MSRVSLRRSVLLTIGAGLLCPLVYGGAALADPLPPGAVPGEGDVAAAIRSADAADSAARRQGIRLRAGTAAPVADRRAASAGVRAALRAPAGWASRVPVAQRSLPSSVDVRPRYVGQNSCDPVDKPGATAFGRLMVETYGVGRFGISRLCAAGQSEHLEGRAIDWMLDANKPDQRAVADSALTWLTANSGENARRLGVMYLIWNRQMWRAYAPERGWQPYRGASPHTDHIHISLTWDGAMQRTSWWTGRAVTSQDLGPCRVYSSSSPAPIYAARRTGGCPATIPAPAAPFAVFVIGQRSSTIAVAQRALGAEADGVFGYVTRRAVVGFQKSQGLPVTGVLDKATWARLVPAPTQ